MLGYQQRSPNVFWACFFATTMIKLSLNSHEYFQQQFRISYLFASLVLLIVANYTGYKLEFTQCLCCLCRCLITRVVEFLSQLHNFKRPKILSPVVILKSATLNIRNYV